MTSSSSPPSWISTLLSKETLPTLPLPISSHGKPINADLTSQISDSQFHPALEAGLHLANGDLYNAHFLVRKSQGGAKELDWGHAVLHRLEGDMGNAKCWYTDLNNLQKSKVYMKFLSRLAHSVSVFQYVDLCHFYSLIKSKTPESEIAEKVHSTTTNFEKIPRDQSFTLDELQSFVAGSQQPPLSLEQVQAIARDEIRIMIEGLAEVHGWKCLSLKESVDAFDDQSGKDDDQRVSHDASSMVVNGGVGRSF
ncbi:unnamed protein product [Sympodiomycopsis kandeliae]